MNNIKSHFKFHKQERSGIFFLLLIILLLQIGYFCYNFWYSPPLETAFKVDKLVESQVDSLKQLAKEKNAIVYTFNPNYISDYRGYRLGMSVDAIDRLHAYRAQGKYVNSAKEFQKITLVSDSLLKKISPFFTFPTWGQQTKEKTEKTNNVAKVSSNFRRSKTEKNLQDLNLVSALELQKIYGVGDVLSRRIVKFRDKLGGFLVNEQLYDVYGLEIEVVKRILKVYRVIKKPIIKKININEASIEELQKLIYIQKNTALEIVNYRNDNKSINSFDELSEIANFPFGKIDRIKLYLSL